MSSRGLGAVTRHSVFRDGNQTTAFSLLKELRNKQAWKKVPLKHRTEGRGGQNLGPHLPWGHRSLPALLPLPGRTVRAMSSRQIIMSCRNIFCLLKKTARLSCLHCCAITHCDTVKLNAEIFFLKDKGFTRS